MAVSEQPERRPTVLVVDDEVLIRMMIADFLRDCGFLVIEAGNADEALRVLQSDEPIDAVFSDVMMPGSMDGLTLAQWTRRERPDVNMILTSGVTETVEAARETCDGITFMSKPYDPAEVERRIRQWLAQ